MNPAPELHFYHFPVQHDLEGRRSGRLVALKYLGRDKHTHAWWTAKCDCGKTVTLRRGSLVTNHAKSCGCLKVEQWNEARKKRTRHGHATGGTSPTYNSWAAMIERCTNPNATSYPRYGGRGIMVCDRWLHSFKNFLADMGDRPEGTSIDRYPDNNGNYEPGNCRWATLQQQSLNRRPWKKLRTVTALKAA